MIADAPIRCDACAALAHDAWLAGIPKGDVVLVRNGALHFRAPVTDATPHYILSSKLKFRRDSGWIVTRQRKRINLRLVRDIEELRA